MADEPVPDLTDDFLRAMNAHLETVPEDGVYVTKASAVLIQALITEILRLRPLVPKD